MSADWVKPTLQSYEIDVLDELKSRDESVARMFYGTTDSNIPEGAIQYDWQQGVLNRWDGSNWVATSLIASNVTTAMAVGTYVIARIAGGGVGTYSYGDTVQSSLLEAATDVRGVANRGEISAGTWRAMGGVNRQASMMEERTTLWVRIA